MRPALKEADDTATIGPVEHLFPDTQPIAVRHGGAQAFGFADAAQASFRSYPKTIGLQGENRIEKTVTLWLALSCIH
ncbi:MAG: hypothetical protein HZB87_12345 [Desulfatitalea sp.]|nr:hypothetical protein [Desulfatitalea sp.]MBI5896077.1 hypothetical protein [Desulfobacterales bacterium]